MLKFKIVFPVKKIYDKMNVIIVIENCNIYIYHVFNIYIPCFVSVLF